MEYLYVCHFSNGHIKVGRSIDPKSRIAAHAERVACIGIELVDHHTTPCLGRSAPAETDLIQQCADIATKRNQSEWFEGLDFDAVCEVANRCASTIYKADENDGIRSALTRIGSHVDIAKLLHITPSAVGHWVSRKRPVPLTTCVAIERATDGKVTRQDLRPDDFWKIWPDLSHLAPKEVA